MDELEAKPRSGIVRSVCKCGKVIEWQNGRWTHLNGHVRCVSESSLHQTEEPLTAGIASGTTTDVIALLDDANASHRTAE